MLCHCQWFYLNRCDINAEKASHSIEMISTDRKNDSITFSVDCLFCVQWNNWINLKLPRKIMANDNIKFHAILLWKRQRPMIEWPLVSLSLWRICYQVTKCLRNLSRQLNSFSFCLRIKWIGKWPLMCVTVRSLCRNKLAQRLISLQDVCVCVSHPMPFWTSTFSKRISRLQTSPMQKNSCFRLKPTCY